MKIRDEIQLIIIVNIINIIFDALGFKPITSPSNTTTATKRQTFYPIVRQRKVTWYRTINNSGMQWQWKTGDGMEFTHQKKQFICGETFPRAVDVKSYLRFLSKSKSRRKQNGFPNLFFDEIIKIDCFHMILPDSLHSSLITFHLGFLFVWSVCTNFTSHHFN